MVISLVSRWHAQVQAAARRRAVKPGKVLERRKVVIALIVLVTLIFSKNVYMAAIGSYYTFFLIDKFALTTDQSQLMLFLFLGAAAVGTVIGGPVGDRIGRRTVIWVSILGVLPFTLLLPYASLFWTGVLSVIIGVILASAFPAITSAPAAFSTAMSR